MLIVLDNFEQVVDAAGEVGGFLGRARRQGRSRAGLSWDSGEQEYVVPGLPARPT
jgi:hypothetical protein